MPENRKGRSSSILTCRSYDSMHKKPKDSSRKHLEQTLLAKWKDTKLTYKNQLAFLYTRTDMLRKKSGKYGHSQVPQLLKKYLGIYLTKRVKVSTMICWLWVEEYVEYVYIYSCV